MIKKCNQVAALGESNVTDPSIGFVQHLADGEFDPVASSRSSYDGELVSVRRPIGVCTSSATSRGAPPESGARARVPINWRWAMKVLSSNTAISPNREIAKM